MAHYTPAPVISLPPTRWTGPGDIFHSRHLISAAGHGKEQVAEAVEKHHGIATTLFPARQADRQSLRPTTDRPGQMQPRGTFIPTGQDERPQRRQPVTKVIDGTFKRLDLRPARPRNGRGSFGKGRDCSPGLGGACARAAGGVSGDVGLHGGIGVSRGLRHAARTGKIGPEIEQHRLKACEQPAQLAVAAHRRGEAKGAIQLIDGAVGLDAQIGLVHTGTTKQFGAATIATSGVQLHPPIITPRPGRGSATVAEARANACKGKPGCHGQRLSAADGHDGP